VTENVTVTEGDCRHLQTVRIVAMHIAQ